MASFVPDLPTMLAYAAACIVLFITPGPDMSLWLSRTLSDGRAGGVAAMIGTQVGCLVHTLAVAVGLSAVLAASAAAFTALKIVGAVYLGWLAVQAIRKGSMLRVEGEDGRRPAASMRANLATGLGINLTNPKIVLFFMTFLPQFVAAGDPHATGKLLFLGCFFVGVNLPLSALMILGAERLVGWLKAHRGVMRGIDYGFAAVFGAFAIKILTTRAR